MRFDTDEVLKCQMCEGVIAPREDKLVFGFEGDLHSFHRGCWEERLDALMRVSTREQLQMLVSDIPREILAQHGIV
jgi:hypothetical protein